MAKQHRSKKARKRRAISVFTAIKEWIIELVLLVLLSVFVILWLIPEKYTQLLLSSTQDLFAILADPILDFFSLLFTPRGILVLLLIIGIATVVVMRIRYHIKRKAVVMKNCPVCDNEISRKPRRLRHHFLNLFVPIRHYYCKSCGWQGLRLSQRREEKKKRKSNVSSNM